MIIGRRGGGGGGFEVVPTPRSLARARKAGPATKCGIMEVKTLNADIFW